MNLMMTSMTQQGAIRAADQQVAANNAVLVRQATVALLSVFVIGAGATWIYARANNVPLQPALKHAGLALLVITVTEMVFYFGVALNYVTCEPNGVKKNILDTLVQMANAEK